MLPRVALLSAPGLGSLLAVVLVAWAGCSVRGQALSILAASESRVSLCKSGARILVLRRQTRALQQGTGTGKTGEHW